MAPRFLASAYLVEEQRFGAGTGLDWGRPEGDADKPERHVVINIRAAAVQSLFSERVAAAIARSRKYETVKAYCERHKLEEPRFNRLLRGKAVMQIEDMGRAAHHFGPRVWPRPVDVDREVRRAVDAVVTRPKDYGKPDALPLPPDVFAFTVGGQLPAGLMTGIRQRQLAEIRGLAVPALTQSALGLHPDGPRSVRRPEVEVRLAPPGRSGMVDGWPAPGDLYLMVRLDASWLRRAREGAPLAVDGHFLLDVDGTDRDGRPVRARALRLLPQVLDRVGGVVGDHEYAASWAGLSWDGGVPRLEWEEPDEARAAEEWADWSGRPRRYTR